ncbi:hypothetical protein [Arthrobacter sp. MYb213]|nr:hypothetical protein [Arthrobacter sp. MYb213]
MLVRLAEVEEQRICEECASHAQLGRPVQWQTPQTTLTFSR